MSKLRQVEELIVGNALSTETDVTSFLDSAADKEIGIFNAVGGTDLEAGKPFKVLQKIDVPGSKYNSDFSDVIEPSKIERITAVEYSPEVQKEVTITGFDDAIEEDCTYVVEIRFYNPMSAHSTENFEIISGYFVTGSRITNVTASDIVEGLAESLNTNLKLRGGHEFEVETTANTITIKGKEQFAVPGKDEGRMVQFEAVGKVYDNLSPIAENLHLLESEVTVQGDPGKGTGKYAVNLEWFVKGFKYDYYREVAYPANFTPPYFTNQGETYNVIHINYYSERESTSVERQYKTLTILIEGADNSVTNEILAKLKEAVDADLVPADL